MTRVEQWMIPGADDESILGTVHEPVGKPRGVFIIAHGFKGYKDYGMFPYLANAMADAGYVAHRFNFSHSGMTNQTETFARPELFERDTWNRQVTDYRAVVEAVTNGTLAGRGVPRILFGHSRGGVTALLTAGRCASDPSFPRVAGVITAASPSTCNSMAEEHVALLRDQGYLESPSSRTGQVLRVGRAFLDEQVAEPAAHDLVALTAQIRCPVLIVHGSDDPTVPVDSARILAAAASVTPVIIPGADHVFNTPNPMPEDLPPSAQLAQLVEAMGSFARSVI